MTDVNKNNIPQQPNIPHISRNTLIKTIVKKN